MIKDIIDLRQKARIRRRIFRGAVSEDAYGESLSCGGVFSTGKLIFDAGFDTM